MDWKSDVNFNILKIGLKGEKVKLLQRTLNDFSGADIIVDGMFGEQTKKRVYDVQRLLGIKYPKFKVDIILLMNIIMAKKEQRKSSLAMTPNFIKKEKIKEKNQVEPKIIRKDIVKDLPRKKRVKQMNLDNVLGIVFHHSATDIMAGGSNPFSFAENHVFIRNFPCIGYDIVVDSLKNIIYKTATLKDLNWHTGGLNSKYYGICIIGNYDIDTPSDKILNMIAMAFKDVIKDHKKQTKNEDWIPEFRFHSEFANKSCPGSNFTKQMLLPYFEKHDVVVKIVK